MSLTIYDISEKAGVSIATVSRVLNGATNVRSSTKEKILKVIEEYGYAPNAFARGMGLHSLKTIGILCVDSSDIYLAKAVYYIEQDLQANGYESLLCCTGHQVDMKKHYLNLILSKKVDSIILVGSYFISNTEEDNDYIRQAAKKVPVMLLNASADYDNVYCTLCDDYSSTYDVTVKMLNSDTSDVIYIYNSESYSGLRKLGGFSEAVNGIGKNAADYAFKYNGDIYKTEDVTAFLTEIAKTHRFNSVIASEDALAIAALKYAAQKGLKVPEDFEVIGYNNSVLCSCSTPSLTSIDNKLEPMTHQLVNTLMGVLNGQEMPKKSLFNGSLVERETTSFEK
ncbi:MAG: LacI family transcriptional regulator [Lachnospiraceae bacterium]|nr:LacI family transcriptional regulator [Lachnospiraceae bacterium]